MSSLLLCTDTDTRTMATSTSTSAPPCCRKRRRRTRQSLAKSAVVNVATATIALLVSSGAAAAQQQQQQQQTTFSGENDTIDHHHQNQPLHPNPNNPLSTTHTRHKHRTLAQWRSNEINLTNLRPLDLVLDDTDDTSSTTHEQHAYQKGEGGFLEPIDDYNYQVGFGGRLVFSKNGVNGVQVQVAVGNGGGSLNENGAAAVVLLNDNDEEEEEDDTNDNEGGGRNYDHHHVQSSRVGLTNFDHNRGIGLDTGNLLEEEETATQRRGEARGKQKRLLRGANNRHLEHTEPKGRRSGEMLLFQYTQENDPEEQEDYEQLIISEEDHLQQSPLAERARASMTMAERRLQASSTLHDNKSSNPPDESSSANHFAGKKSSYSNLNNTNNNQGGAIQAYANHRDTTPPIIRAIFPPSQVSIGAHQTFGALVSDNNNDNHHAASGSTSSGVRKVCLQFRDHANHRSACFPLKNVGDTTGGNDKKSRGGRNPNSGTTSSRTPPAATTDIWELSFEGFELFAGQSWAFRVKSTDGARNKKSTGWRSFSIDERAAEHGGRNNGGGGGDGEREEATGSAPVSTTSSSTIPPPPAVEKLMEDVKDSNWPHGGVVQYSTGRIMFFFDNNPYVCTGTVLKDTPSDRSIIVTAAHCAYQYRSPHAGGGRFAEHALFIPNQVDTRAYKSNGICSDDPLGCWIPAFAVVDYEWTTKGFPDSVPFDYAYYVIPNDESAHERGYIHEKQPELSKILDDLVEPLPIDFDWKLGDDWEIDEALSDFGHGLGYSFNKDPAFRYCSSRMSRKYGISTYGNLWLGKCEMTGGSSGGPWVTDLDNQGRGTVISVNSWGYSSTPGMGGPNFCTKEGGKAECLFEKAKNARFEDVKNRGIVADC